MESFYVSRIIVFNYLSYVNHNLFIQLEFMDKSKQYRNQVEINILQESTTC